jgi:oligoribonuclease NrnB/cAMP/cGMP phosphodiesterase (DHH superfamily)
MRLVTRSDFDGLIGAVLLKELELINSKKFVHPKDIQDGITEINKNDILVNVPYDPRCGLWFDHHISEQERGIAVKFEGASWPAPSAARVIYEYYGGDNGKLAKFSEMIVQADKCDSANFTREEVLNPTGMVLLSFIMDPRSGFGKHTHFHVSNYQLIDELIECMRTMTIDEIMELEDIKERIQLYEQHREPFIRLMKDFSHTEGTIIITDLRGVEDTYVGNRHVVYALYPEQNISLRLFEGKPGITVISVGYSILNRTATVNVGSLLLKWGGGGHKRVGTCQVPADEADAVTAKIIEEINASNWHTFDVKTLQFETV